MKKIGTKDELEAPSLNKDKLSFQLQSPTIQKKKSLIKTSIFGKQMLNEVDNTLKDMFHERVDHVKKELYLKSNSDQRLTSNRRNTSQHSNSN